MDYNLKYYYTFKDYEVGIYEKFNGISIPYPMEITAGKNNCYINYINDYLYNPVRASGAEIKLVSTSDRMFLNLYTNDMMKYQVRITKDENLFWLGYLDSENYSEDFSKKTNYIVSLTANDGFNLLNRMYYGDYDTVLDTFTNYTGIRSQWETLNACIQEINLPWEYIYVGLSTTSDSVIIPSGETLLHNVYINNANFYNEDNEPESFRKVLESILLPYGAFIIQQNGSLIITDSNYISTSASTMEFKRYVYGYETTHFDDVEQLSINNGIISTSRLKSNKINLSIDSGINKQVLSYSPYNQVELLKMVKDDFSSLSTTSTYGSTGYKWVESGYTYSTSWDKYNNGYFIKMKGIDGENVDVEDEYLKIVQTGTTGLSITSQSGSTDYTRSFYYKMKLPDFISSSKYYLRINFEYYIRTVEDLNNLESPPTIGVISAILNTRLKIGNKKFHSGFYRWDSGWVDESDTRDLALHLYLKDGALLNDWKPINDKWMNYKVYKNYFYGPSIIVTDEYDFTIPLENVSGELSFEIFDYRIYDGEDLNFTEIAVEDFRLKNLVLSIVDIDGNEIINNDIEYFSKGNINYKNEGQKLICYLGTNVDDYPAQRGNLLYKEDDVYYSITGFTRNSYTDIVEKLLLRSIKSNYGESMMILDCDLKLINNNLGLITYPNYTDKKFVIIENSLNLEEDISELKLREINQDIANII